MANDERETALWAVERDCNGTHLPCQMILLTSDSTSTTSPFEIVKKMEDKQKADKVQNDH